MGKSNNSVQMRVNKEFRQLVDDIKNRNDVKLSDSDITKLLSFEIKKMKKNKKEIWI